LGAAWLEREDGHIKVEIIIGSISENARHILDIITSIIGSITCIVITMYGFRVVFDFYQRNVKSVDILETKLWYIYIVIPIGFLFYLFQIIRRRMNHVGDNE
jgi:TRAP-type C4-dicarboxylate transport system permease small subunit